MRSELAIRCGTTLGHITNISYGYKSCSEKLAVAIERETCGAVTRRDLRPVDWQQIWPELATQPTQEAA
ncbi:YdaS family helix-turn-helix protein [Pantoea sp. 18069]|uniref:transcriptional regulator n=1 Tax=Pantoea sp. 18069 TaxID=2681415 RepID=UPI001F23299D|nr:YdaS family helix-turn-helix protein [Pantoea sp. 18069]